MPVTESGTNWEVISDFIPANVVRPAAEQAIVLAALSPKEFDRFASYPDKWDNPGLSVIRVSVVELVETGYARQFADLLNVFMRTENLAQNGLEEFFLNRYAPLGQTARHRDDYRDARETVGVGLTGVAELFIEDPTTGAMHDIPLVPGDAIHLWNDPDKTRRPTHVVGNTSNKDSRISLVNG